MQLSKPPEPKATRKRLKKEILSDDFKKRKISLKNIAENFLWKIFHLTSLHMIRYERVKATRNACKIFVGNQQVYGRII
jgi:hypothetical protein